MISILIYFLLWTFVLYCIHRLVHVIPFFKKYHMDHHKVVVLNKSKWELNNLLLYNDTKYSTVDLWITEVVPSFLFSLITGQWWVIVFYYFWAALLQEKIEHNQNLKIPFLTSGRWHLAHHRNMSYNYGLFIPLWDKLFKTER